MKQSKRDWTAAVRRSLEDTELPLPEGGWERLERDMGAIRSTSSDTPSYKIWIRFAATAAAVLVCVSIGVRVIRSDKNVLKRVVSVSEAAVREQDTDAREGIPSFVSAFITVREKPTVVPTLRMETASAGHITRVQSSQKRILTESEAVGGETSDLVAVSLTGEQEPLLVEPIVSEKQETQGTSLAYRESASDSLRYNTVDYDGLFAELHPIHRGGSISLSAGGIVTSSDGSGDAGSTSYLLASDDASAFHNSYREFSYDHKQPIGFGLAFRKEFRYGLSLESGFTYTLLRSSVAIPGLARNVSQKLHFVGIPLRLNWEFFHYGQFSLYAGVGGRIEKCVSARFAGEKIVEKGVLWSLSGVVGAQYKLGKTVGIYFQPEILHYLTETTLQTPYTDSAVNLNLQLGVRFNY